MSNTSVEKAGSKLPAFQMSEKELMDVLRSSLYLGAQDSSIKMAVNYCKASGLDIMQKPVHLVPMWDSKTSTMRDVVMAGIGMYRTQASRSGEMAGITEPEYGDDVTEKIGGVEITYPKWCKVTVKRTLPNGGIAEFVAVERWIENYAAKGGKEKSIAPNAMWTKRPYAQLAKCAEAQALRKAFPELGAALTAEEMEGKEIDITPDPKKEAEKTPLFYTNDEFLANEPAWKKVIANGKSPERFIAFIESQGKLLDKNQKEEILLWEKKPQVIEGEATQVQDDFVSEMNRAESEGK